MSQQPDQFTKWMLGVTASIIVAIGVGLMTTTLSLREDMAVIKSELVNVRNDVATINQLHKQIENHEYRIRWIEESTPNNSRSSTQVFRDHFAIRPDSTAP